MSEVDILLGSAIIACAVFTLVASRRDDGELKAPWWARRVMTIGLLALLASGVIMMVDGFGYDLPNIQPFLTLLFVAGAATFAWIALIRRRAKREGP